MEAELADLLVDSITIEAPVGATGRGKPSSYGTAVTYACRIEPSKGNKRIRMDSGEEVTAEHVIYVNCTVQINPVSRLTLPSGYTPQQPPILSVGLVSDETGPHHTVIYV